MFTERRYLSPIEKELKFSNWCRNKNVERFLFDLDDTICPTRIIFKDVMAQAYDYLAAKSSVIPREKWKEEVEEINNRNFEKYAVNSNRWDHVVDELSERHMLADDVNQETKRIFQSIYKTPVQMMKGAEEGLGFIKKVDIPIGIVTHAGKEWTWKKYNWLNLDRFVEWDDVFVVDENKHKTSQSWEQAIGYFGLRACECAVVGDSPRSDINPAWDVGVKQCFLVEDSKQWSVHKQPVPPAVKRINQLIEIPDVIIENDG